MKNNLYHLTLLILVLLFVSVYSFDACAESIALPGINLEFTGSESNIDNPPVATAIKIILTLTVLSLAPGILVVMTSFTRIIIVLAILRHAFSMQQTPPNTVLIGLALFLTIFNMQPVLSDINENSLQPYLDGKIDTRNAVNASMIPLRRFMLNQTRKEDLALMVEIAKDEMPKTVSDINTFHLIPAFMISELKKGFQIGFVIFLPFLLIDIVIASILMSMGMLMVPPLMISLPIKILMFVLIDGWYLVIHSLMASFY